MKIYLVRHAEPTVKDGQKHGLSPQGILQAKKVAVYFAGVKNSLSIGLIYSPVLRCKQTAEIISSRCRVAPISCELRFKNANNLKIHNIESKYATYMRLYKQYNVESPDAYKQRFMSLVRDLGKETLIVVGNEVNIKLLLQEFAPTLYNRDIKHAECFEISINV